MAGSIRRRRMIAAAVALAAIVGVVLLATGAFSGGSGDGGSKTAAAVKAKVTAPPTPTATTAQPAAAPLVGKWQGTATQTATTRETYPADVRLAVTGTTVGKAAGTLSEKARGQTCKGDVKLVSRDASHVFRYDENPAKTGCIDRTTVTVTPAAGGSIDFYEIYTTDDGNQGTVVGKLKRAGGTP